MVLPETWIHCYSGQPDPTHTSTHTQQELITTHTYTLYIKQNGHSPLLPHPLALLPLPTAHPTAATPAGPLAPPHSPPHCCHTRWPSCPSPIAMALTVLYSCMSSKNWFSSSSVNCMSPIQNVEKDCRAAGGSRGWEDGVNRCCNQYNHL